MLVTLSFDEDVEEVGEDEEEELVDRPGITNVSRFHKLQLIFVPFWVS